MTEQDKCNDMLEMSDFECDLYCELEKGHKGDHWCKGGYSW